MARPLRAARAFARGKFASLSREFTFCNYVVALAPMLDVLEVLYEDKLYDFKVMINFWRLDVLGHGRKK